MSVVLTNNNFPHGFKPLMENTAGGPVGIRQYGKGAADSNAIYCFDLLLKTTTSVLTEGKLITDPGCQTLANGTPGTTLILGSSLNWGAASTITWHTVIDDPTALFEAQVSGTAAETNALYAGDNANVLNTAQTSGTLMSAMQINYATLATTAGLDLRLLGLYQALNNTENAANAIFEVLILKHAYASGSAGV